MTAKRGGGQVSDQPKWMPSEKEITDAIWLVEDAGPGAARKSVAALIRAAVEKALAEREARHREDLRVITEATRMAADKRAERHKRELIEARIYECEEYGDCICERYSDPTLNVRHRDCEVCKHLDSLRAELAALDKEGDHE